MRGSYGSRAGRASIKAGTYEHLGQDILSTIKEEAIGLEGMKIDRLFVRLLHRHNDFHEGEIMLETEELDSVRNSCLATVATLKAGIPSGYRPNSWKLCENQFVPIEFSFDPEAVEAAAAFDQRSAFHREFADLLQELLVDNLPGPWVAPRLFYRHDPGNDAILLESCDSTRRANILKYGDPTQQTLRLIETSWVFRPPANDPEESSDCNSHCSALCDISRIKRRAYRDWTYWALYRAGFASQPTSVNR